MSADPIVEDLRKLAKNATRDVTVLQYSRDFETIWSSLDDSPGWKPAGDVFVVWDGISTATDDVYSAVDDFLTVYDWAAAMALHASSTSEVGRRGENQFRLFVLEFALPDEWSRSFAVTSACLLGNVVPWMKIYPMDQHLEFSEAIVRCPTEPSEVLGIFVEDDTGRGRRAADLIRRLWSSELTNPYRRHSVSNIIGPAALSQSLKIKGFAGADRVLDLWQQRDGGRRKTFWRFLEILGLVHPSRRRPTIGGKPALGGLARESFVLENLFGRFSTVRFALVDDQASSGFHDALAVFLLGEAQRAEPNPALTKESDHAAQSESVDGRFKLTSFDHPAMLLKALRVATEGNSKPWYQARVVGRAAQYGSTEQNLSSPSDFDILFLDLRLHGLSNSSSERARAWRIELLNFAQEYFGEISHEKNGISSDQQIALTTAVNAAQAMRTDDEDDDTNLAELALLPILISCCDPTIPIVLFSSTQQRRVLELLSAFPNIMTSFSKPAITGYAKDDLQALDACLESLARSLRGALILHEKRCLWHLLVGFSLDQAVPPRCILSSKGQVPMPSDLKNIQEPWDLPFTQTNWHKKRLFDLVRDYIQSPTRIDLAYKPYEFVESSLLADIRPKGRRGGVREIFELNFTERHFRATQESLRPQQTYKPTKETYILQDLKGARNFVVHGIGESRALKEEVVRYFCFIVYLQLIESIADDKLKKLVAKLAAEAAPLIRSLIYSRDMDSRPGDLNNRLSSFLSIVWPGKPKIST